jgi:hypothetical protein
MAIQQKAQTPLIPDSFNTRDIVPVVSVSLVFVGLGIMVYLYPVHDAASRAIFVAFVTVGWFLCILVHEAGHAIFINYTGENSLKESLRMNFIKFKHPINSLLIPIIIMFFLGYGIPGGLDYLDESILYRSSRIKRLLLGFGGLLSSFCLALMLALPLGLSSDIEEPNWLLCGVGCLLYLLIFSICMHLVPIPPMDMFSVIYAQLPSDTRSFCQRYFMNRWVSLVMYLGIVWGAREMRENMSRVIEAVLEVIIGNIEGVSMGLKELYLIYK